MQMKILDRDVSNPDATGVRFHSFDLPFAARLSGMLLVGASLLAIAQNSQASTVEQISSASPSACKRMSEGLVAASHGSALKVVRSEPSSRFKVTTIFVADGEVRIACDYVAGRMSITRTVNLDDESPTRTVGLLTPVMPLR